MRVRWVEGMQSAGGGWGAFDADNTRALVRELPFLDFGEVIDEPSADVTAHTLEMLAALGLADTPLAQAGLRWLIAQQEPGGSWFGRWGVNHIYGTGAVLPALIACGIRRLRSEHPPRGRRGSGPPERGRRLGRGPALIRRGRVDRRADASPPLRPPGRCWRCTPPESARGAASAASRWLVATPAPGRQLG